MINFIPKHSVHPPKLCVRRLKIDVVKVLFFLIFVPFILNATGVKHKGYPSKKKHYAAGQILTFTIPQQIGSTVIDETNHFIAIVVHAGTDVTALISNVTVTPGYTVSPASGVAQNFSSAVAYIVSDINGVQTTYYSVNVLPTRVIPTGCSPASATITGDPTGNQPILSYQWQMLNSSTNLWVPAPGPGAIDQTDYQTPTFVNNTVSPVRYTFRRQLTTAFGNTYDSYSDYTINPPLSGGNMISQPPGTQSVFCGTTDTEFLNGDAPTGGDGNYTYQWQSNTGAGFTNIPGATFQGYSAPASGTTISYQRLAFSTGCSLVTSNIITMTVIPVVAPGTISQPVNSTFCESGAPGVIPETPATGGNGTYHYQWQTIDANGLWINILNNGNNETYDPGTVTTTTAYRRTVTSGACGTAVATNPVTITITPGITGNNLYQPGTTTFCQTSPALSLQGQQARSGANIVTSYQWYYSINNGNSWIILPGKTGQDDNSEGPVTRTTWFRRQANYGTCSTSFSDPIIITVQPPLRNVLTEPDQIYYCNSAKPGLLKLEPVTGGDGLNYTYQWKKSVAGGNFELIPNAISDSYDPGTITVTTSYVRIVTSGSCSTPVVSNPINIFVNHPAYNNVLTPPTVSSFCISGDPGTIQGNFPAIPDYGVTYTFQWQTVDADGNGTDIPGATDINYSPGTLTATTTFRRLVITTGGCTAPVPSNNVTVTIQQKIDNNIITANGPTEFCGPGTPQAITGAVPTGGNGANYSYQWYSSTNGTQFTIISGATSQDYNPGHLSVTTYFQRWVISGACITPDKSMPVKISIDPPITGNSIQPPLANGCGSHDPGLARGSFPSGGNGTYVYQWESSTDGGNSWQPIANSNVVDYDSPPVNATTEFHRIVFSGPCSDVSAPITYIIKPSPPNVIVDNVQPICSGSTATLKVANPDPALSYSWFDNQGNPIGQGVTIITPAINATATFSVIATNSNNCSSLAPTPVQVTVNDLPATPVVQISPGATQANPVCINSIATLTAGNPNDGLKYNWYTTPTGGIPVYPDHQSIQITVTDPATVWYVEAVNGTGCSSAGRGTATIFATSAPLVNVRQPDPVCANHTATLQSDNNDPDITVYWYTVATGGSPVGQPGNSFTTPAITGNTTFYAETRTSGGCISATRTPVQVILAQPLTAPSVFFESATASTITFRWGAVAGATGYQYSIDGGQTYSSPTIADNALKQTISNLQLGQTITFMVRAVGTADCQTSATSSITGTTTAVTGIASDEIFVANAFTPNGDGRNDIVYVHNENIKSLKFYVYNQYGELLFTSLDQSKGWDGSYKGKLEPVGVYVYYLEATMNDGKKVNKKGTITLLR